MVPIPYTEGPAGRTDTVSTTMAFCCPTCDGPLALTNGSWTCSACGFVPRHGAD